MDTWDRLVAAIPWLGGIPAEIAATLDLDEFVIPAGRVAEMRRSLETEIGAYVMTYRGDLTGHTSEPGHTQLCRLLEPAPLDATGLAHLQKAESTLQNEIREGVVLCAYARPLAPASPAIRPVGAPRSGSASRRTPRAAYPAARDRDR